MSFQSKEKLFHSIVTDSKCLSHCIFKVFTSNFKWEGHCFWVCSLGQLNKSSYSNKLSALLYTFYNSFKRDLCFYLRIHLCECMVHVYLFQGGWRGCCIPWSWRCRRFELSDRGVWNWTHDSWKSSQQLSTAEPSLQPPLFYNSDLGKQWSSHVSLHHNNSSGNNRCYIS